MLNVHFWTYHVPSRAWTPLQPLRLDFFGINFPSYPRSKLSFLIFCGQYNRTRVKARRSHERALLPNLTTPATSPHPRLFPAKVSACRTILRLCTLLEIFFPCVSQNNFPVKSPCYSLVISSSVEVGEGDSIVGGGVRKRRIISIPRSDGSMASWRPLRWRQSRRCFLLPCRSRGVGITWG